MTAPGGAAVALFFRYGGFSHINLSLLPELRAATPNLEIVDVDLEPLVRDSWFARLGTRISKVLSYGPRRLAGRPIPADAGLKTPFVFDRLGQIARAITEAYGDRVAVTFQTQCLFDARSPGIPHLVYTDHTHLANLSYAAFDRADLAAPSWIAREGRALRRADAALVMSEHVRASMADQYGVDAARIHNVGAGMNAPPAPRRSRAAKAGFIALFVGVEWERKGGPELVEAIGRARAEFPGLTLTIVGCEPPGLPDYCKVVGRVPLEAVGRHMAAADLFCFPTRIEPFGIVVLEAMAARLPVVVPRLGAFPDFITHGANGFLHEPLDVGSITGAILEALRSGELPEIGARARTSVVPKYTWRNVALQVSTIMAGLARAPQTRPGRVQLQPLPRPGIA